MTKDSVSNKKKALLIVCAGFLIALVILLFSSYSLPRYTQTSPDNKYRIEVSTNLFHLFPAIISPFGDPGDYDGAYVKLVDVQSGKVLHKVYTDAPANLYSKGIKWEEGMVTFHYSDVDMLRAEWSLPVSEK